MEILGILFSLGSFVVMCMLVAPILKWSLGIVDIQKWIAKITLQLDDLQEQNRVLLEQQERILQSLNRVSSVDLPSASE